MLVIKPIPQKLKKNDEYMIFSIEFKCMTRIAYNCGGRPLYYPGRESNDNWCAGKCLTTSSSQDECSFYCVNAPTTANCKLPRRG